MMLLLLFYLPAMVLWLPVFAFAYWRTRRSGMRGYIWAWAWALTAAATTAILGLIGFFEDVLGSV
jgi:hypothetical protein